MIELPCNKCKVLQFVLLDKTTNKAHCNKCDSEIQVNHFQIRLLEQQKQFRFINNKGEAWATKCKYCSHIAQANIKNNKGYCKECGKDLEMSPLFLANLRKEQSKKTEDI